ncbi:unnamed protein product [Ambrosiozyma monospora]|uniref:Unnamed protein product n=1 Tax=Ambrosiozyma monospora TaxID=43982 RepID=A0ACB5STB7_AMBMO|nr:unnamed protein product [Ambrosiozyma monospora]
MNEEDQTNLLGAKSESINKDDQGNDNDETGHGGYTKESYLFGNPWPYEVEWERDSLIMELGYNEDDEDAFTPNSVTASSGILAKGSSTSTLKLITSQDDSTSQSRFSSVGTFTGNVGGNFFPFGQTSPLPPLILPPHLQENQVKLPVSFPRLTTVSNAQTGKSIGGKKTIPTKTILTESDSTKTTSESKVSTVYVSVQSTLTKSVFKKLTSSSKYVLIKTITEIDKTDAATSIGGHYSLSDLAVFTKLDNKRLEQLGSSEKPISSLVSSSTSQSISHSSSSSSSTSTSPLTSTSALTSVLNSHHRDDKPKHQGPKTMPSLEEIIQQNQKGKDMTETGSERERLVMPQMPYFDKLNLQEKQFLHGSKSDDHAVKNGHEDDAEANDALSDHIMSRNSILFMFGIWVLSVILQHDF